MMKKNKEFQIFTVTSFHVYSLLVVSLIRMRHRLIASYLAVNSCLKEARRRTTLQELISPFVDFIIFEIQQEKP
jgi:hypothetical protein